MNPNKITLLLLSSLLLGKVSLASLVNEVTLYFIYQYSIYQQNIESIPTAEVTFI